MDEQPKITDSQIEADEDTMEIEPAQDLDLQAGAPASVPPPGLARAVRLAAEIVRPLVLDGENAFHHYKYPTIAQVRQRANRALTEAGISLIPSIVRVGRAERTSERGKTISITAVDLQITISSDEGSYQVRWTGESEDAGDKGIQKAVSAAMKSFLTNMLLIPVQEPETDESPAPEQPVSEPKPDHWLASDAARRGFWRWCGANGLSSDEVHAALGVASAYDYAGTREEAKQALLAYIQKRDNFMRDVAGHVANRNGGTNGADQAAGQTEAGAGVQNGNREVGQLSPGAQTGV